jgi:hypothetical protein
VSVAWFFEFLKEPAIQVLNIFQVNVSSSSQNHHHLQFFWEKIKIKEVAFILKTLKNLGFFFYDRIGIKPTVLWPSLEKHLRIFQKLK